MMSQKFLREANEFEKLAKALRTTAKTDEDKALASVAEGLVKVCEMLAELAEQRAREVGG